MKTGRTEAVNLRRLGDVAEVLPGFSTGTAVEHDAAGTHQLVQIRHLKAGMPYRYRKEDAFRIDPGRSVERFLLRPGDVLFMSRGTRNVASWLEAIPEATLAATSFYVLRPGPKIDPGYLTWYVNQPGMQRKVAEIRTGAGAPIVQRHALRELEIPIPPLEEQQRIGALGVLIAREQALLLELQRKTDVLRDVASAQISHDLRDRASPKQRGSV